LLEINSDNPLKQELIPFSIPAQTATRNAKYENDEALPGNCLLDTGAKGSSFMSDDFANQILKRNNRHTVSAKQHTIQTAGNNNLISNQIMSIDIALPCEKSHSSSATEDNLVHVDAAIAPISTDLIIDKDTIRSNDLVAKFPSHFAQGKLLEHLQAFFL